MTAAQFIKYLEKLPPETEIIASTQSDGVWGRVYPHSFEGRVCVWNERTRQVYDEWARRRPGRFDKRAAVLFVL